MATSYIQKIAGKNYLFGMLWQDMEKSSASFAKQTAKSLGDYNFFAFKKNPWPQAGFSKTEKIAGNCFSAAAALATHKVETEESFNSNLDWIGIFELTQDLFYLVAIQDSRIHLESDKIGNKEKIQSLLNEFDLNDYKFLYAPSGFKTNGDIERKESTIESLLTNLKPIVSVKPVATDVMALVKIAVCIGAISMLGIYGAIEYKKYNSEQALAIASNKVEEKIAKLEPIDPPKPWINLPTPNDLLRECVVANSLAPRISGWQFEKSDCTAGGLIANYKRTIGTAKQIQNLHPDVKFLDAGLNSAQLNVDISTDVEKSEVLSDIKTQHINMISHMQSLSSIFSSSNVGQITRPPKPADPKDRRLPKFKAPFWKVANFNASSEFIPTEIFSGLDLTGVRIDSVVFTNSSNVWQIKGKIYGK